ncbi:MAG: hypothetical protein ACYCOR_06005 [Acidobacteriaceae bacterium]
MKRFCLALLSFSLLLPSIAQAKTHKDDFAVPCSTLWSAVKDTLRNSGKYGILGISDSEQTASYIIGGALGGKRINSLVLNPTKDGCELQTQTAFSGLAHNDAKDMKNRIDASLQKIQAQSQATDSLATQGKK